MAPTISFDLEYVYFACVVNSIESVTEIPEDCTVAFTGYKKDKPTPEKTVNFQFNPTNPLLSDMIKATFPRSFTGLDRVEVSFVQALSPASLPRSAD